MRLVPAVRLVVLATPLIGCASLAASLVGPPRFQPSYEMQLVSVQRPAKAQERYGPQALSTVAESSVTRYSFEDNLVRVVILASGGRVGFDVKNKTDNVIKLPWNEAALVDIDGKSQQVMHNGMKYTECMSPKAPSVLPPKGSLDDEVIPCSNVRFGYSSWIVSDLVPGTLVEAADTARAMTAARGYLGKQIRVLLPLQIEDVVNDYVFTFEVKGATLAPWSYAAEMAKLR